MKTTLTALIYALFLSLPVTARADTITTLHDLVVEAQSTLQTTTAANLAARIAEQHSILKVAHAACLELGEEHPELAELLNFVISQTDTMVAMSLDEIESAWHEGQALEAAGFINTTLEHFGVLNSHVDMIVHPATVLILLREFERTGDPAHLTQAREELEELAAHIEHS
jgi:hypothetical protein